ncbi:hypothetical protein AKJ09_03924 [Labilithrix luteola]|uniref:Uncharacterized protein n=1 Tax=Labilithrix luteola TaxID=1391654 RepID=A0A0K1PUQ6_9BACT|nr:hypothetical protein AKJ09_03924 [Labilithrix luteola]
MPFEGHVLGPGAKAALANGRASHRSPATPARDRSIVIASNAPREDEGVTPASLARGRART